MDARDQTTACRTANGGRRVPLREHHTLSGHAIQLGRFRELVAHTVQRIASLRIGCNQKDVGSVRHASIPLIKGMETTDEGPLLRMRD